MLSDELRAKVRSLAGELPAKIGAEVLTWMVTHTQDPGDVALAIAIVVEEERRRKKGE